MTCFLRGLGWYKKLYQHTRVLGLAADIQRITHSTMCSNLIVRESEEIGTAIFGVQRSYSRALVICTKCAESRRRSEDEGNAMKRARESGGDMPMS